MIGKKGITPLISAIIFLAFIVSVVTVVIQLGSFMGGCGEYEAEIVEMGDMKRICYNTETSEIEITVSNGEYEIIDSTIHIVGEWEEREEKFSEGIEKESLDKIVVPYDLENDGVPDKIIMSTNYDKEGDLTECVREVKIEEFLPCDEMN